MAPFAIPKMTKPWKVVAAIFAVYGFVSGYVGWAGRPFCGSVGQCLTLAMERGPAGFDPPSLFVGAIGAALFGAAGYLLFLLVYAIRKALQPADLARLARLDLRAGTRLAGPPVHLMNDVRFCWRCGRERLPNAGFCAGCGQAFGAQSSPNSVAGSDEPEPRRVEPEPTSALVAPDGLAGTVTTEPTPEAVPAPLRGVQRHRRLLLGGGLVAILLTGGGVIFASRGGIVNANGSYIEFHPTTMRCDGTPRGWDIQLPAGVSKIIIEMHRGGLDGQIVDSDVGSVDQLGHLVGPNHWQIATTDRLAWECRQPSGSYTMVIRDWYTDHIMTSGSFQIG